MSEAIKPTPGPWQMEHVPDDGGEYAITAANGIHVGLTIGGTKSEQANARLIAAAPELLQALQFVMTASGEQLSTAFEQAQAAIAKATGEQT